MDSDHSDENRRYGPDISCWCHACGAYLFTAPNSWMRISKRAVIHSAPKYRMGDIELNLNRSAEEFEGAGSLLGCTLKYLFCKGRRSAQPCTAKLGLYCVRGTRDRRYKGAVFLMHKYLVLRHGKNHEPEDFNVNGEIPPEGGDTRQRQIAVFAKADSPQARSPEAPPVVASEVQVPSSPVREATPDMPQVPATQDMPIRTSPLRTPTVKDLTFGLPSAFQAAQQVGQESITMKSSTLLDASGHEMETMEYDDDDEEDMTGMIQIGKTTSPKKDDLLLKVNAQSIQLQKQGLLLEKQKEFAREQQDTIDSLVSRVESLESQLKSQYDVLRAQIAELGRKSDSQTSNSHLPSTQRAKRPFEQVEQGLSPYRSPYESQDQPAVSGDSSADNTQALNEYLKKTVREDDPEDGDYNPTQYDPYPLPASMSMTQLSQPKDSDTINVPRPSGFGPARALERSPRRARGRPRVYPQTQMRPLSFQDAPPQTPTDHTNTLGSGPNGHTGSIIRRGISGRAKAVPPELSRGTFSASKMDIDNNPTSTPPSFGPDPKRQRVDLGSGSFGSIASTPTGKGGVDKKGMRDAEGYLLKSNGQRDLRSIRGRTLGSEAFKPTDGHRRTVASLMASGIAPSPNGKRVSNAGSTQMASTPTPAAPGASAAPTLRSPTTMGVTTISTYLGEQEAARREAQAQAQKQKTPTVYDEAQKANQARINQAMGLGKEPARVYSDRHSAFMDKLKLG